MRLISTDYLIHNPRLLSTLLFLGIRKMLGRFADMPVRALLACFAALDKLPTRSSTGCFVAAFAEKPVSATRRAGSPASKHQEIGETAAAAR
jgi:hypothetical protein